MISLVVIVVVSYLLGSIPASIIAGKVFRKIDIREHGSGNAGGTNAFRVMGWKIGLGVSLFDIAKGTVATVLVSKITIDAIPFDNHTVVMILAGLGAILGHTFTIFGGFRGGKGVATGAGMIIGLYPLAFIFCLLVFAIVLFSSGLVSLSSMSAATSLPIILYLMKLAGNQVDLVALIFSIFIPLFIIYTHRSNVKRLVNGEEKPFEKLMIFKKKKA